MGINKENLLSDAHHASHFSCAIGQDLSESPVTLACSHVFCEFCVNEYVARCLDRQQNALCPTCRASDCSSAAKLSEANPLAFRCYAKVQTKCPLHKQGCAWTGDLGSLQGHLTNSDSHLQKGMSQGDVYDALKKEGDERYRARAYDQAAELYSKAAAVAQPLAREPSTFGAPGSALIAGISDQIAMNGVTWRPGISIGAAVTRCSTSRRRYVLAA